MSPHKTHTVLVMAVAHCKRFLTVTPTCISALSHKDVKQKSKQLPHSNHFHIS